MTSSLLRRRVALVLAVATIPFLASCSSKAPPQKAVPSASASSSLVALTPPGNGQVDSITWNLWEGEPYTLNPFQSADYKENTTVSNLCETLLLSKPDFSIGPNLATKWSSPDPKTWVFDLRSDVTFWDGSPMTADDVAFSMNANRADPASLYGYLFARVDTISATSPTQVTVKLKSPDYMFPNEMADFAGAVVSKKFYEANAKTFGTGDTGVMCTGPYKVDKWTKGDNIAVSRYDGYWDKTRTPKVKKIKFTFVTDEASITNAMLTGQIDGGYDPPVSATDQLKASTTGKVYLGASTSNLTYALARPDGLFANLDVRKALNMAIDWNGLAISLYKGTATRLNGLMPPTVFTYGTSKLQAAYAALPDAGSGQLDAAKKLVAKAGDAAKTSFVIAVPAQATPLGLGNAVVDAAKRIGLKGSVKEVPPDQYTAYLYDPKTRAGIDLLYTDFWPNVADPLDWLGITAAKGGSFNQSGYSKIDDSYAKALETQDPDQRATLVGQMMTTLTSDMGPMVPGLSHSSRLFMNNRISGAPASFSYVYYPWAAMIGGTG